MLRREGTKTRRFGLTAQQAPHASNEMHAAIEQETALVFWRFAPGRFNVFRAFLDAGLHAHAEVEDAAEGFDALGAESGRIMD